MLLIPLSGGLSARVDDADLSLAFRFWWRAQRSHQRSTKHYVYAYAGNAKVYLHRLILGAEPGVHVDHINGDPLDNRRANLRLATLTLNNVNREVRNMTGLRGVSVVGDRFKAMISSSSRAGRRSIHLGCFDTPEEAARAYDAAALVRWGIFARLNFPIEKVS